MKSFPQIGNFLVSLFLVIIIAAVINLVTAQPRGISIELSPPPTPAPVRVHVNGAVIDPGVYSLPSRSIVQDAIEAAGGLTSVASIENINLASPLQDGQLIYIFSSDEPSTESSHTPPSSNTTIPRININTADASDLERLPGIGPSLAGKIVEFRQLNGTFETVEQLLEVSGIGPSKLEEIKDYIIVR
jgi:competence protein ComEA